MIIAGLKFRALKAPIMYNTAGVYVYKHKASGKCFVRAMKNCRNQRSKNNYPMHLKQYLKQNPSDVIIYLADLKVERKEALFSATRAVADELSSRGLLYKLDDARVGLYKRLRGEEMIKHSLWSTTHVETGAVFYFYAEQGKDAAAIATQRLKTFDNYVEKGVVNANRTMHFFTKKNYPLSRAEWVLRDLGIVAEGEKAARLQVAKLSKTALEQGTVVLNRICDTDALYYRNAVLKLEHKSMDQYLG